MIRRPPIHTRIVPAELRHKAAIELLRIGYDTSDIAYSRNVSEASIYNAISSARETERVLAQLDETDPVADQKVAS